MCSNTCPCFNEDVQVAESWMGMSESDLNKFNRTKANAAEYIPLDFVSASAPRSYDKFKDCYEEIRSGKATVNKEIKDAYNEIAKDPAF